MAREQHDYDDIPGTFVFDAERFGRGSGGGEQRGRQQRQEPSHHPPASFLVGWVEAEGRNPSSICRRQAMGFASLNPS